jgi:hypothetical protein
MGEFTAQPANRVLLDYLQAQAKRSAPGDLVWDGWELRTHPDTVERFEALAPHGHEVVPLFGVPALAAAGVIASVALGTGWLMVRLPSIPSDLATATAIPVLAADGWQAVAPWQYDLPTGEADTRLTDLISAALGHARTLTHDG